MSAIKEDYIASTQYEIEEDTSNIQPSNIQECIDGFLRKRDKDRSKRVRSGKISPSSLGRCLRYQYWYCQNEPPTNPIDERTRRIFACGDLFHNYVKSFIDADFEVLVENEDVKGYADAVKDDEVMEFKSQHSKAFWYMKKELETKVIGEIKPEHVLQGAIYCMILGKPFLRLVYISKDDLCILEFKIQINDEITEKVNKEIRTLKNLKTLPPPEPRAYGGKECSYCVYRSLCKGKK